MADREDSANVRIPPPLIYLAVLALAYWAGRALCVPRIAPASGLRVGLGWLLIVCALAMALAGIGQFRLRKTAVIPHKPASQLVTAGVYRWTRNPMYVGMALLYAGLAVLLDSLLALLLLPLVLVMIQTQVIAREEAYLERRFGDEYRDYRRSVRRWF